VAVPLDPERDKGASSTSDRVDAAERGRLVDAALQARGWSRSGPAAERREVWGNEASGVVGRVFAPDPEQPAVQAIDLGVSLEPPACSGSEVVVAGTREAFVAAMPDGGLVVVQPVPEEVVRQHAACRCFPGCGAQQAAHGWHRWVSVEALEGPILGVVKLPYAATSLVVSAVDSTTCCCVP